MLSIGVVTDSADFCNGESLKAAAAGHAGLFKP